tara:strand:- start:3123 stop:3989 length:867 start_codon:yes stop_codon:yes gene_type:complete
MQKLGVIGQGYVGSAVKEGFNKYFDVKSFDRDESKSNFKTMDSFFVWLGQYVFVCVPTPMNKNGSCNTDIVESVVKELDTLAKSHKRKPSETIVIIKSTIPPGTTERLDETYKNIKVCFSPEFLTEANFIDDFKNQNRIIIGGNRFTNTKIKSDIFVKAFPDATIVKTSSTIAEMVKYTTNCFLATKVSFANEVFEVCERLDVDYDKVVEYATYDERLGKSHWAVPGPDGHYGFGGSCFPKDINALIDVAKTKLDLYPHTLIGAWNTNLEVRPEEDWKELKGRAVVDE